MDLTTAALVTVGFLGLALVSGRISDSPLTPPMLLIAFGFAIGPGGLDVAEVDPGHGAIHVIAELTLILVLFADAARIDLGRVRSDHGIPVRMLVIGLPLVMIAGAFLATLVFPGLSLWEAALLAALLAPTDAALGQTVVTARAVPLRIRQALNVESGLNDGIALPAVLLFAALAGGEAADAGGWLRFAALQVVLGPLVGIACGYAGARLLDEAAARRWATTAFQGIGILAVAILTFAVAELTGGNGFIAAFVGGMTFGNAVRHPCTFLFEFMESEGQLLMLITFLVFGAAMLPDALAHADARMLLYAALSLTVIRLLPIGMSLIGSGMRLPTQLFLGWFGPRGLASILFALLILEDAGVPNGETLMTVTVLTVALSALLHGASAAPLAGVYGRLAAGMGECAEKQPVADLPLRGGQLMGSHDPHQQHQQP